MRFHYESIRGAPTSRCKTSTRKKSFAPPSFKKGVRIRIFLHSYLAIGDNCCVVSLKGAMDSASGAVVVDLVLEAVLIVDVIKGVAVGRVHLNARRTRGFVRRYLHCIC